MGTKEVIDEFKEKTGISIILSSKEGVPKEYNLETENPEVLSAMIATVYGAAETAMDEIPGEGVTKVTVEKDSSVLFIREIEGDLLTFHLTPETQDLDEEMDSLTKEIKELYEDEEDFW